MTSHLEQPEKSSMCEEEVRIAASNLEKVIFDSARSKISYKAAIVNRRKEVITCTENFATHTTNSEKSLHLTLNTLEGIKKM